MDVVSQIFGIGKYLVAIAIGYLAGRMLRWRSQAFLFVAVVVMLVFFVTAEAAGVVLGNAGAFLAISTLYALSLVLVTGLLGSLFDKPATAGEVRKLVISLYVAAALATGVVAEFNYASAIDPLLHFLLFIAGIDMAHVKIRLDRSMFLAPVAALLAASIVGPLFALFFRITPAVAFRQGWYSFTGSYLASVGDAAGQEAWQTRRAGDGQRHHYGQHPASLHGALRLLHCPLRICQRRTPHGRNACGGSAYTPAIHLDAAHPLKLG
jgi:uncharacterized membrane protein YbjE (DUF340 family)